MFVQFGALQLFDPSKCFTIKTVSNITIINSYDTKIRKTSLTQTRPLMADGNSTGAHKSRDPA